MARFFDFVVAIEQLPVTTIDTKSFLYGNDDLVRLDETSTVSDIVACEGSDEGEYAWAGEPDVAWCWSEEVWSTRLLHCIRGADAFSGVDVHAAFRWTPRNFEDKIGTLSECEIIAHVTILWDDGHTFVQAACSGDKGVRN